MDVNEAIFAIYQQTKIKPTYTDFARIFGVKRQSVSMMVTRSSKLSEEKIKLLEQHYNISLNNVNIDSSFLQQQDLTQNLTADELNMLKELINKDKEVLFLFCRAWLGDTKANEQVKKLL